MRITFRIDDDLSEALKRAAARDGVSLTAVFNRTLRAGLASAPAVAKRKFVQRTYHLGARAISFDKALALAAALDDVQRVRLHRRRNPRCGSAQGSPSQ